MSKKVSKELNFAIKEFKSCFNCTFFKIKPFQSKEKLSLTNIDFNIVSNKVRCSKEMLNKSDFKANFSDIRISKNNGMVLRDSLKSVDRYKNIASVCKEYDGED